MSTQAHLTASKDATAPRFLSLSQRIGRLRYFVYLISGTLGASASLLFLYLLCQILPPPTARLLFTVGWILIWNIVLPMLLVVMVIRRLHDLNAQGWWSIAVLVLYLISPQLIALGTLLLLAPRGSIGNNRFGPQPAENGALLQVAALILPLALITLFVINKDKEVVTPNQTGAGLRPLPNSGTSKPSLQAYPAH